MRRLSALEVFPTLARYKAFSPRRPDRVSIGNQYYERLRELQKERIATHQDAGDARLDSLFTLYHDLGVLAFAGCNAEQTRRIGSILERVVAWGGTADLRVLLKRPGAVKQRMPVDVSLRLPEVPVNHSVHTTSIDGQISVDMMIDVGNQLIERTEPLASVPSIARDVFIKNKVLLRAIAPTFRPGIYLETDTGKRRLPLAYHVSLFSRPDKGRIKADVWLSTIGREDIVGHIQTAYETGRVNEQDESIIAKVGMLYEAQEQENRKLRQVSSITLDPREATFQILSDLWALEREIWAHRSNVGMKEQEKQEKTHPSPVKLRGETKKGKSAKRPWIKQKKAKHPPAHPAEKRAREAAQPTPPTSPGT